MGKGFYRNQVEKQRKGNLSDEERNERDLIKELSEHNILKSMKNIMATKDGQVVINWILKVSKLFDKPDVTFTNSGKTGFNLGERNMGKKVFDKVIESGSSIDIIKIADDINYNRLNEIEHKLVLLKQKKETK
jgi:hypothetical protein